MVLLDDKNSSISIKSMSQILWASLVKIFGRPVLLSSAGSVLSWSHLGEWGGGGSGSPLGSNHLTSCAFLPLPFLPEPPQWPAPSGLRPLAGPRPVGPQHTVVGCLQGRTRCSFPV